MIRAKGSSELYFFFYQNLLVFDVVFEIVIFSSRTTQTISTKFGTHKESLGKGVSSANKGLSP